MGLAGLRSMSWLRRVYRQVPVALVLLVGLAVSVGMFALLQRRESSRLAANFRRDAASVAGAIRVGVRTHLETLCFVRKLYESSERVERDEFEVFAGDVLQRQPGYRAVGWAPRVGESEQHTFEHTVRAAGFAGFRIHPRHACGARFPVDFLVPYAGNERLHGYDLAADERLRACLERAAASGEMTAATTDWPGSAPADRPGLVAVIAVYRDGSAGPADLRLQEQVAGFVVGFLQVAELMQEALAAAGADEISFNLREQTGGGHRTLFRLHGSSSGAGVVDPQRDAARQVAARRLKLRSEQVLDVAGQQWVLELYPGPDNAAFHPSRLPHAVLVCGILLALLSAGYCQLSLERSTRVERLVAERTRQLAESNRRLQKHIEGRRQVQAALGRNLERQVRINRLLQEELPQARGVTEKLQRITDAVVEIFGADFCRIWVIAPGDLCDRGCVHARLSEGPHACRQRDRCLHLRASSGRYTHTDGRVHRRVPFGCYKIGRVAAGEDPKFLTNDVQHDPRVHDHEWARRLGLVAFAGYRLSAADGTPIGVLALFARQRIGSADDNLLAGLASSTSQVIQAARAEEALREAYAQLEVRVEERTAELARANRDLQIEIEERAQMERSLRESEQRYRHLFEELNDAGFLADVETGRILEANRQAEVLLGLPRDRIVGRHHTELHPPQEVERYRRRFAAHAAQGKESDYDGEVMRADGRIVPVRISAAPLELDGRRVLLGLFQDITERKRAEEQTEMFARQQNTVNDLLQIRLADAPLEEILERCLDKLLFNGWLVLAPRGAIFLVEGEPPELVLAAQRNLSPTVARTCARVPLGRCLCGRAAASGQAVFAERVTERHEVRYPDMEPHGHYCVPIRAGAGVIGVLTVYPEEGRQRSEAEEELLEAAANTIAGIIERKRVEQRLRDSEERHRTITHAAQDAIITADAGGVIRFWNPAAERMFGYSAAEAVGRSMLELIVPPQYHEAKRTGLEHFAKTGRGAAIGKTLELSALRKDGSEFPIQISVSAYRDREGYVAVAVVRDITERKQAEARLQAVHRQLLEASRRAGMAEIATGVLHNVGNVLNSVNVSATLAASKVRECQVANVARAASLLSEHTDRLAEFLATDERGRRLPQFLAELGEHLLEQQAEVLRELDGLVANIEHLKTIVSMQQSYAGVSGVIERVELREVLEDALKLNGAAFERRQVEIRREYEDVPPLMLDKHRLLQILINLLRNARYALSKSPQEHKRLTLRLCRAGAERVALEVCDNGVGIAPENLTRIFSHGFTTRRDGHGFGLHSSALAAREMGGTLTAQSAGPGQGATFRLELPLNVAQSAAPHAEVTA